MSKESTFQIRVHGETEIRSLTVKTGVYQLAAVAAPAVFGLELPVCIHKPAVTLPEGVKLEADPRSRRAKPLWCG
jgi:hypothetical protein